MFFDFAFETLERWEELDSVIDAKTVALVAGQGEGTARDLVTRWSGSEPAGFDRREAFLDARDVELGETTVLAQRGDAYLAATGAETSLEADVHQYGGFRYREHWDVGDLVTVRNAERGLSYAGADRRGREVLRAERRRADDHRHPRAAVPDPGVAGDDRPRRRDRRRGGERRLGRRAGGLGRPVARARPADGLAHLRRRVAPALRLPGPVRRPRHHLRRRRRDALQPARLPAAACRWA